MFGSFQTLENVNLICNQDINLGSVVYPKDSTFLHFTSIQFMVIEGAGFQGDARGGRSNDSYVYWDNIDELGLAFAQGVFSLEEFSVGANAALRRIDSEAVRLRRFDRLESDESGTVELPFVPNVLFIRDNNNNLVTDYVLEEGIVSGLNSFSEYIFDYEYCPLREAACVSIGQDFLHQYFRLEGEINFKDENIGNHKGVIKIPKVQLQSSLSLRLGDEGTPTVVTFKGKAFKEKGRPTMEVYIFE